MKKKIVLLINVFLYFEYINFLSVKAVDQKNNRPLVLNVQDENGKTTERDLIEFLEEMKEKMARNDAQETANVVQKKAVVVLGLSGTGKTTLINYLNDVPLICYKVDLEWRLDLAPNVPSLPGGFKIGHGKKSGTFVPASYTPSGAGFTYIDNPGFQDTRSVEHEIANSFLREYVTTNVDEVKFLLLLTQQDLTSSRGERFKETLKRFSSLLGIFDSASSSSDLRNKLDQLSNSIALIVTRVVNDGLADAEMRRLFRKEMLEILNELKTGNHLSSLHKENVCYVFNNVLKNVDQLQIFSNPNIRGPVGKTQSENIKKMIEETLVYSSKQDAKIQASISPDFLPRLFTYIEPQYDSFKREVSESLATAIERYLTLAMNNTYMVEDLKKIYNFLENIRSINSSEDFNFEAFLKNLQENRIEANVDLISDEEKRKLIWKKNVLDYFINLLPDEMRTNSFEYSTSNLHKFKLDLLLDNQLRKIKKIQEKEEIIFDSVESVLTVKKHFMNTTELIAKLNFHTSTHGQLKHLILIAYESFYFDTTINFTNYHSVTVIAPKWTIGANVVIDLSGTNAADYNHLPPMGTDGLPGQLGGNSGKFYGFGHRFINLDNVRFNLDGGRGGKGQHGGTGWSSPPGTACTIPSSGSYPIRTWTIRDDDWDIERRYTRTMYENWGSLPSPGGNGGRGGAGGSDGLPGFARIYKVDENRLDTTTENKYEVVLERNGVQGAEGSNGVGGAGGHAGCRNKCHHTHLEIEKKKFWRSPKYSHHWENFQQNCVASGMASGVTPVDLNTNGLARPTPILSPLVKYTRDISLLKTKLDKALRPNEYFPNHEPFYGALDSIDYMSLDDSRSNSSYQIFDVLFEECMVLESAFLKSIIKSESNEIEWSLRDFVSFYRSLVKKLERFKQVHSSSINDALYNMFLSFAQSRLNYLNSESSDGLDSMVLIISIGDYMKQALKNFDLLKELKATEIRNIYESDYYDFIDEKINEANGLIKNVHQSIEEERTIVEEAVADLENKLNVKINSTEGKLEEKKEKLNELIKNRKKSFALEVFGIAATAVGSFFGPIGVATAGIVASGLEAVNQNTPENYMDFSSKIGTFIGNYRELKEAQAKLKDDSNGRSRLKGFTENLGKVVEKGKKLLESRRKNGEELEKLNEAIQKCEETLYRLRSFKDNKLAAELGSDFSEYITTIQNVSLNDFNNSQAVDSKNLASLDFYFKHKLKPIFTNITKILENNQLVSEFGSFKFGQIINNLKEVLDLMYILNKQVQTYNEHLAFTEYLSNYISAKEKSPIPSQYQSKADRFISLIQLSLVTEQYKHVTQAAKQWMFPFAIQILNECKLPTIASIDTIEDTISEDLVQTIINNIRRNLIKIETRIETYLSSVQQIDQAILKVSFAVEHDYQSESSNLNSENNNNLLHSFYIWSCQNVSEKEQNEHSNIINQLFTGKEVALKANPKKSIESAVKFNRIELKIIIMNNNNNSQNGQTQQKLDQVLQDNFNINLKHGGISYFKYNNSFYSAWNDRPFLLTYSFKKIASPLITNRQNQLQQASLLPVIRNAVYEKMMNGQFMISPYTTWTVQLVPKNNAAIGQLNQFIENVCLVKLALVGEGSYVNEELVTKQLNLDNFYRKIEL